MLNNSRCRVLSTTYTLFTSNRGKLELRVPQVLVLYESSTLSYLIVVIVVMFILFMSKIDSYKYILKPNAFTCVYIMSSPVIYYVDSKCLGA